MNLKKLFLLFAGIVLSLFAMAQEVLMPLTSPAFNLPSAPKPILTSLHKAGQNFPLIDFFLSDGRTNKTYWKENHSSISKEVLIFNALDSFGNVYANGPSTDIVQSQVMGTENASDLFVAFTYSSGSSFSPDDSLVLFAKDILGEWIPVWKSTASPVFAKDVIVSLSLNQFATAQFEIKWVAYTNNLASWNQNMFGISKVVIADKWPATVYEHMRNMHLPDSTANWELFSGPHVKIIEGAPEDYIWGNCARLDVLNAGGLVYDNASNQYGGADTLYTHPINIIEHPVSDSLFLLFTIKASNQNQLNDSFIVEFYNNLGQWVKVFAINGKNPGSFQTYTIPLNNGRNRHANFKIRFYNKTTFSGTNTAHWLLSGIRYIRRIELPLFDDFSNARVRVSSDRWMDSLVYVNNDFPVRHPSLNVATFDGLDANGNAYSPFATKGVCDVLTSRSMNLKGLVPADSVILSFYYQYEPQGTTNQVYPDDKLQVELRSTSMDADSFIQIADIWADDSLLFKFTLFQYVIKDPRFLNEDFQIRIKNRGSLTGNLSQWHIDYIRFNKGRKLNDPIKDIALSNTPPVLLGMYTSMPWYQYNANKGNYGNGSTQLRLVNHDNQAYAVDYFRSVIKPEGDTLDKFNNILPTLKAQSDSSVVVNKSFNFASNASGDSLVFQTKYRLKISGNQNDNVTGNDTFSVPTIFSNYYAYDDGTAEGGYGIKNKINVGAALKYTLEQPDSVVGVYIFFNQSEKDVSLMPFTLKVWKKISPLFEPATSDELLYTHDVAKPTYTGKINGFTSYRFSQPVAVSDSFYIGWEQSNAYVLNIGLDKNFRFVLNPNQVYKMDGRWYPTEIPGALMIRPIMKKFLGSATGIAKPPAQITRHEEFNVYPNPARNQVSVDLPNAELYRVRLIDISGKEINELSCVNGNIQLPAVVSGFYFLVFENPDTNQKFTKKIIIEN